jgi:hypothetical protein
LGAVAGAEAGFSAIQIERQHLSFHHQTLIRGLEMQWTAKVAVQVELHTVSVKAGIKAYATYKQPALVVLSGQLSAPEEEQAALIDISK